MSTESDLGMVTDDADMAWAIVDAAPDAMIVAGADGRIVLANRRAHELFGFHDETLEGHEVDELLPESLRGAHAAHRESYGRHPRRREMGSGLELLGHHVDGRDFPVEVSLSPVDRGGESFVIAVIRDLTERRMAEESLRIAQQRLAMVDDRERIGRDLHDTVIQRLYGAGLALQASLAGDGSKMADAVRSAVDEIDSTIGEIRSVIHDLRRRNAASEHLGDRLQRIVDAQSVALGIDVTLHMVGRSATGPAGAIADAVVAVVREGLANAHRHGRAQHVVIDVVTDVDEVVRVVIHDDGVGFSPDAVTGGDGLGNLRERAERLGGTFSVDSTVGHGTDLVWQVPLA